ncbi:MAG: PIN domain-containing protein [Gracilimonas sp.]|jgi:predicted nucleic acid-binding protein|nr:PIN domain-containing protein [Gracilimonas sp.]
MKQRVYIDTSVIGGYFDREFAKWSKKLFKEIRLGNVIGVVSDITLDELAKAPKFVIENFNKLPKKHTEVILSDKECYKLADEYVTEGAVTNKYYEDALHIALAIIDNVNVLASWNFKHIVNLERIRKYNSVNLKNGYQILEIRTPREILSFNDE